MTASLPPLYLIAQAERRLKAGHLWIYSNEIDTSRSPLREFEPGAQVQVMNPAGKPLGIAYVNPHTLIAARLISRDHLLDKSLLVHRLQVALSLRERLFDTPHYRLVYGDADLLPGLVVDRYGDYLVVQLNTAGMERVRNAVIDALVQVLAPRGILFRNDSRVRAGEQLESSVEVVHGEVPAEIEVIENGCRFHTSVQEGQKTGWFYDHRVARSRLPHYVAGRRVLDVFSYIGGWGIQAAVAGASEVVFVDASGPALERVGINAELNGVADRCNGVQGDATAVLRDLIARGERFDTIILDPPAFIPRRKDQKVGQQAYRRINELAMRLLSRDGLLVSASCSLHLTREQLVDLIRAAGRHVDRHVQILEQHGQGPDHPVHPAIPETAYLKSVFCRVLTP
ncbi:MAG: class I SAM-dependent rRNA methyltransferase [Spongiibacteraceae bacterium]|jgi:23S rRNA (cytosine1962-C5)-methyltransferase|nr:class I SAM-dependent rRNA methyltransferase [Spongiibacteraceae bacterium]